LDQLKIVEAELVAEQGRVEGRYQEVLRPGKDKITFPGERANAATAEDDLSGEKTTATGTTGSEDVCSSSSGPPYQECDSPNDHVPTGQCKFRRHKNSTSVTTFVVLSAKNAGQKMGGGGWEEGR
jgi:hypothetical protein